ncbi:hypothetical protein INR49_027443 [Caranx melampygus]|nr:hypothetical protein INR49_027443 [Caranx melampygus]
MQDLMTSEAMEDQNGVCPVTENEVEAQPRQTKSQPQASNNRPNRSNGQCVVSVPSCSSLNPTFDLSLCRAKLENDGFQIPVSDLETPLKTALDVPSVRRYMVFNSALFHFIMAPVLYVVVWCAVFSTLHLYITVSDYWVLCLSVSLVAIFLTTAIIFILHHSNKEVCFGIGLITMNLDVRLIQVNERMVKHKLLVAVADWVQNCTGVMQLFFVYWDMSRCLRALTETLEERSFVANDTQVTAAAAAADPEVSGSDVEQDLEEQRPLLRREDTGCSSSQREHTKAKAYQLLMTYSATYVKLLVSEKLSGPSHHHLRSRRNHCTTAPLCLCQYIKRRSSNDKTGQPVTCYPGQTN